MKVAYFAESEADEAALKILSEAILARKTESVIHAGLRHRGWPAVKQALPAVLKELHYHTDAEGFVFIVDSNGAQPHDASHPSMGESESKCRLCQLRAIANKALKQAKPRTNRPSLKLALGLAVPAIEAWLLCGVNLQVSEATWINGRKENKKPYTTENLKEEIYGTFRPSLADEKKAMTAAAARLAREIGDLERSFPQGFGALRMALKSW